MAIFAVSRNGGLAGYAETTTEAQKAILYLISRRHETPTTGKWDVIGAPAKPTMRTDRSQWQISQLKKLKIR